MAINTYFKNIADAIREKTGGSAFITPGQMPQAIRDISGGGLIDPLHFDLLNNTYIATDLYAYSENTNPLDVYEIENGERYFLYLGSTISNRFRVSLFDTDPASYNGLDYTSRSVIIRSQQAINTGDYSDNPIPFAYIMFQNTSNSKYLAVHKSNNGTLNIKTYLLKVEV
jgi:hypothetical protein